MNTRNTLFMIYVLAKYLVTTKIIPLIREMLSTPLTAYILVLSIFSSVGKIWFDQVMTVAAPVEVAINDYHLIYVIAIATFVLIIRKNAKWLKDIEPLTIERWWKIFQISNIEMAYMLLWALAASISFLTLFSAPVGLALMVMGYGALGWMMRWIFNNKLKQNMAYYV